MANATSPLNTNTKDLDPLVDATGASSLKRAVGPIAAAGIGDTIANQGVATDVDDAAFTPGTSSVVVAGALADETASDSVDEGDAGALRMTLNRRLITAGQLLDDAAFGVATDYVSPIAGLADETAADSVDEGDIGAVRMTLDRRLHVAGARYNGSTYDTERTNLDATLLSSAERTATTSSADQTNYNGRGCVVVFDFTVETDAGVSIVLTIEGKDVLSGKYYTILTSAALTAVGTTVYTVYPGVTAAANVAVSDILPRTWRVTATPADNKRATYSVGASVIL